MAEDRFATKIIGDFWPRAEEARGRFEAFIGDAYAHTFRDHHECWDCWFVPGVYFYLRTDARKIFGEELVAHFTGCLRALALALPTLPWLTLHLPGMRHELHNDAANGQYAYVFSLTRDPDAFEGGTTCIVKPEMFKAHDRNIVGGYFEIVKPVFNQLLLFNDQLPHMVPVVQGPSDPLKARLCLTGHLV